MMTSKMFYHEGYDNFIKNLVTRYFEYIVKVFLQNIVLNSSLDKTRYYAIFVDFSQG